MFHGSMVAMVTPMAEDGSVDYAALANLVEFHIDNSTDAIVLVTNPLSTNPGSLFLTRHNLFWHLFLSIVFH